MTAIQDRIKTEWERIDDFLQAVTALQFGIVLILLIGLFVLSRAIRSRVARVYSAVGDTPLPAFVHLCELLERGGLVRSPAETLISFAVRVEESQRLEPRERLEYASLIRSYEQNRYGNLGDILALSKEMNQRS